ncbi:MAG: hypothetical protein KKF56_01300 [Nanoarchaeota archaeon]|nr:hypothetical protein [Nanoarchaeota archaeon]
MKSCIYCKVDVADESVIDFCDRCGEGVFGRKMLEAIKENMEKAERTGNLNQGSISFSKDTQELKD